MQEDSSNQNGVAQSDSDTEAGEPCSTSKGEKDVEIHVPESQAYDDLERLTVTTFNRILWWMRVTTPFFILLGYVLERTIYRDVQRKAFGATEKHTDQ